MLNYFYSRVLDLVSDPACPAPPALSSVDFVHLCVFVNFTCPAHSTRLVTIVSGYHSLSFQHLWHWATLSHAATTLKLTGYWAGGELEFTLSYILTPAA